MHAQDHEELHLPSLHLPFGSGPHLLLACVSSALSSGQSRPVGIKPVLRKWRYTSQMRQVRGEPQWMWLTQYCKGRLDAFSMNTFEDHNCIEIRENSTPGPLILYARNVTSKRHSKGCGL
jgi:hypothetical protein